eukprot:TRINITY_DN42014_c0_g1_i1.p3 TRINITY_DN42014_c0_g1~~TRINITY_DN42014_c0_g1_i1.p3  ORF type:complete len:111 (+),score=18.69 TRINITY_DN42014_c0_g1_i1:85-417(+)
MGGGKAGPPPPSGADGGKGGKCAKGGKGGAGLSYKEQQEARLQAQMEELSAPEGYAGRELTAEEAAVVEAGGTDQEPGPYAGRAFLPTRGYFACKRCGSCLYMHTAKFVH